MLHREPRCTGARSLPVPDSGPGCRTSLGTPSLTRTFSHYRFERELGRGGMATVFLATDTKHDRPVALKVLHSDLAAGLGPERFEREIRLTARLDHPHILPVLDSGETEGQLWYTMPYVEGETLRDQLRRELQLPVDVAVRIASEVADGPATNVSGRPLSTAPCSTRTASGTRPTT